MLNFQFLPKTRVTISSSLVFRLEAMINVVLGLKERILIEDDFNAGHLNGTYLTQTSGGNDLGNSGETAARRLTHRLHLYVPAPMHREAFQTQPSRRKHCCHRGDGWTFLVSDYQHIALEMVDAISRRSSCEWNAT